jgi:hypothetical protein
MFVPAAALRRTLVISRGDLTASRSTNMRNCSDSRAQRWHYGCPRLMRGTSSPLASSPQRFEPSSEHEFTIFVPDRRCVRGPRDVPPKRARGVDAGSRKSGRKDCRSRLRRDCAERRIVRGPGALSRVALRRDSGRLSDPRAGSRVSVAPARCSASPGVHRASSRSQRIEQPRRH